MVAELWLSCSDGHPQRRLADGFRLRCQGVGACVVLCVWVWVCEGVCQGLLLGIEAGGLHRLSPTDLAVGIDLKTKQNKSKPGGTGAADPSTPEADAEGSSLLGQPRLHSETCVNFEEQKRTMGL